MKCEEIDDHDVELYVLNKLQDQAIRAHLEHCQSCAVRIIESRDYIAAMKKALGEIERG
jgi:hypothetical protein